MASNAIRNYLLGLGWDTQWVETITRELTKLKNTDHVGKAEAMIAFLKEVGLPSRTIENMAVLCKPLLSIPVDDARAVVKHLRAQGLDGAPLQRLLSRHPGLLTYTPQGNVLAKGRARASLELGDLPGGGLGERLHVWREGATFGTAPLAPITPANLD